MRPAYEIVWENVKIRFGVASGGSSTCKQSEVVPDGKQPVSMCP